MRETWGYIFNQGTMSLMIGKISEDRTSPNDNNEKQILSLQFLY